MKLLKKTKLNLKLTKLQKKNNVADATKPQPNCTCEKTLDYIFSKEGQGGKIQKVISPKDTIFIKSIKLEQIADLIKKYKQIPKQLKENKVIISQSLSQQILEDYNAKITKTSYQCYGLNNSNIVFRYGGRCVNETQLNPSITNIIKYIQKSSYCTSEQQRCNKHIQVLKDCSK